MPLTQIAQDDFAVGTLRGLAQDVQPGVGVHQALNGLINDDGDVYMRGLTLRMSTAPAPEPLLWLWSGYLGARSYVLAAGPTTGWQWSGAGVDVVAGSGGVPGPMLGAVIGNTLYLPTGATYVGDDITGTIAAGSWGLPPGLPPGDAHVAAIAGRLVVARGNRIAFSESMPPATALSFIPDDYHELPGGMVVLGLYAQQDTLLVFTNFGLWTIGNMAYDLTDAAGNVQQTLSQTVPGLSLLHESGLCPWQGRIVAPCVDKIYLVDTVNPPTSISDSIAPIWNGYTEFAARPGGAKVFRDTLLLPMIDRFGEPLTLLTCRLNRPVRARYVYHPWTELAGHAMKQLMLDFYATPVGPSLIGAGADGWVNDLTPIFRDNFVGPDADGTRAEFILETRDFPTGQGQPNHIRRVRVGYSASYALPGPQALLEMSLSSDGFLQELITLEPQAIPPNPPASVTGGDTSEPLSWWLPNSTRRRFMRMRMRIAPDQQINSFAVHRVELRARAATHAR